MADTTSRTVSGSNANRVKNKAAASGLSVPEFKAQNKADQEAAQTQERAVMLTAVVVGALVVAWVLS